MNAFDMFAVVRKHPDDGSEYPDVLTLSSLCEEATRKASEWEQRLPYLATNNPRLRVARFRVEEVTA